MWLPDDIIEVICSFLPLLDVKKISFNIYLERLYKCKLIMESSKIYALENRILYNLTDLNIIKNNVEDIYLVKNEFRYTSDNFEYSSTKITDQYDNLKKVINGGVYLNTNNNICLTSEQDPTYITPEKFKDVSDKYYIDFENKIWRLGIGMEGEDFFKLISPYSQIFFSTWKFYAAGIDENNYLSIWEYDKLVSRDLILYKKGSIKQLYVKYEKIYLVTQKNVLICGNQRLKTGVLKIIDSSKYLCLLTINGTIETYQEDILISYFDLK